MRVTHQSMAASVLNGLQGNITRLADTQMKLSSGRLINRPSDSPGGLVSSMQLRTQLTATQQYVRNADDGIGWLGSIDTALTSTITQVHRSRDLVLQGMSSGSYGSPEAREALAAEVDRLRESILGLANTTYLDRPVFGGTTASATAYTSPAGAYAGDNGQVRRSVGPNTKVRVDSPGTAVFGAAPNDLFSTLTSISNHLRTDPTALSADLTALDAAGQRVQSALSDVGARYNQVEQMRQIAETNLLSLRTSLSEVEDIDLPKTITDLQIQQTAYQAALAAGARVVQPSLVDFLR